MLMRTLSLSPKASKVVRFNRPLIDNDERTVIYRTYEKKEDPNLT